MPFKYDSGKHARHVINDGSAEFEFRDIYRTVTSDTVRVICNLRASKNQEQFVAPNAVSIAEAYFTKEA